MSDEKQPADGRMQHIKDRISSGFPKLGNKLDKLFEADETRYGWLELVVRRITQGRKKN
jgi:hypothetical protein